MKVKGWEGGKIVGNEVAELVYQGREVQRDWMSWSRTFGRTSLA